MLVYKHKSCGYPEYFCIMALFGHFKLMKNSRLKVFRFRRHTLKVKLTFVIRAQVTHGCNKPLKPVKGSIIIKAGGKSQEIRSTANWLAWSAASS